MATDQRYATLRFGATIHAAVNAYVARMEDPMETFGRKWDRYHGLNWVVYRDGESWEEYASIGMELCRLFVSWFDKSGIEVLLSESNFVLYDKGGTVRPDILGVRGNQYLVVDLKVTEGPLDIAEVRPQLQRAAYVIQQEFGVTDVVGLLVNLIKTGNIAVTEIELDARDSVDIPNLDFANLLEG